MNIKTANEYISELKKGNNIRIIYNKNNEDNLGGWWKEELWKYNNSDSELNYICEYPVSSYNEEFITFTTETTIRYFIESAIRDVVGNHGENSVESIIVENVRKNII